MAFFKTDLARKNEAILTFTEELKRVNERLHSSRDDVEKLKAKLQRGTSAAAASTVASKESSVADVEEMASIIDSDDIEMTQR